MNITVHMSRYGTYLCVHVCIVMYLHKFKHILSMCVLGMDKCL